MFNAKRSSRRLAKAVAATQLIEELETRRLLAVTATVGNGSLVVTGTSGADDVEVGSTF